MSNSLLDIHIIKHPIFDRSENIERLIKKLEGQPVKIHIIDGFERHIGKGRAAGFRAGNQEFCSYIDDDDDVELVFDDILEVLKDPAIDAVCTREAKVLEGGSQIISRFPYKYYDKRHLFRLHHLAVFRRDKIAPYIDELEDLPDSAEHYLWAKLLLNNAIVRHIPIVGYKWFIHANDSKSLKIDKPEKANDLFRELHNKAKEGGFASHVEDQQLLKFQ